MHHGVEGVFCEYAIEKGAIAHISHDQPSVSDGVRVSMAEVVERNAVMAELIQVFQHM
ncbi:MAG: hypothetical protein AMXMBFR76_02000 [Pseudomonadota bacterium]